MNTTPTFCNILVATLLLAGLSFTTQAQNSKIDPKQVQAENRTLDALSAYRTSEAYDYFSNYDYISFNHRKEQIAGNPFLISHWVKGDLVFMPGNVLRDVPLKLDIYQNVLLAKRPTGDSIILDVERVREFTLYEAQVTNGGVVTQKRVFRRYADAAEPLLYHAFCEVLADGPHATLLKLNRKGFKRANAEPAYGTVERVSEIVASSDYYVRRHNGDILPIKPNRKALLSAFPEFAAALTTSLAGQSVRTEKDLVGAVLAVNTMEAPATTVAPVR